MNKPKSRFLAWYRLPVRADKPRRSEHCFSSTIWWRDATHPYHLLQRSTCTRWTPHRRCWTRRLPLKFRKGTEVSGGRLKKKKRLLFSYQEKPPKWLRSLWFHHQKAVGVCLPSAAADKRVLKTLRTAEQRLKGSGGGHLPALCRPARSASRWAQKHLPSLWWPGPCWPA